MAKCLNDYLSVSGDGFTVFHGSNLDVLPLMADNSVDSIVTDPPYELGFMGKSWDSSGIAYSVELWAECLRVLKPGGHLLAFGGSRTWHRLAVAIEDAGFDVRDSIAWLYGSGFPKSLDISKAIDKQDAAEARRKRDLQFVEWMRTTGLKQAQINEIIGKSDVGSHYLRLDQPVVATAELFDKLRPYLPEVPDYIEQMVAERTIESENFKKREVIGSKITGAAMTANKSENSATNFGSGQNVVDVTAPATPEAEKWAGWGTALKPAFEPVVVARKPLGKGMTVAENVLAWGVGGLNIDGSRIGWASEQDRLSNVNAGGFMDGGYVQKANTMDRQDGGLYDVGRKTIDRPVSTLGRWPANIILDEYTAELLDEQSEQASRFFYVAKASKRDRNEGLDELPLVSIREGMADTERMSYQINTHNGSPEQPRQNFHPTVKPTDLMRYLIKLVTPAGGTVLDPFTGSGSTGKAALLDGYKFTGIELTADYLPIIEGRLKWAAEQATQQEEEKEERLF